MGHLHSDRVRYRAHHDQALLGLGLTVFHELRELISVETPLGHGYALFVESGEHDNWWTVALDNRALVTFAQAEIKISRSYTHGRGISRREMKKIIST